MAFITRQVSDLTGMEADKDDFGVITVRQHPELDAPVQLDYLPKELAGLKTAGEFVVLEVRKPGETASEQKICTIDEFNKLAEDMPAVLDKARGTRGRRPRAT